MEVLEEHVRQLEPIAVLARETASSLTEAFSLKEVTLDSLKKKALEIEEMRVEINTVIEDDHQFRQEVASTIAATKERVNSYAKRLEGIEAGLASIRSKNAELEQEYATHQAEVAALQKQLAESSQSVAEAKALNAELEAGLRERVAKREALQQEAARLDEEAASYTKVLTDMNREKDKLLATQKEYDEKIVMLEATLAESRAKNEALDTLIAHIASRQAEEARLNTASDKLAAEIAANTAKIDEARANSDALAKATAEAEAELMQVRVEAGVLTRELETLPTREESMEAKARVDKETEEVKKQFEYVRLSILSKNTPRTHSLTSSVFRISPFLQVSPCTDGQGRGRGHRRCARPCAVRGHRRRAAGPREDGT